MPRIRLTEQQIRERELKKAIARAQIDMDLPLDQNVADELRLGYSVYSKRKREPYRGFGFDRASELARRLHFTGKELCAICGVPYEEKEKER